METGVHRLRHVIAELDARYDGKQPAEDLFRRAGWFIIMGVSVSKIVAAYQGSEPLPVCRPGFFASV